MAILQSTVFPLLGAILPLAAIVVTPVAVHFTNKQAGARDDTRERDRADREDARERDRADREDARESDRADREDAREAVATERRAREAASEAAATVLRARLDAFENLISLAHVYRQERGAALLPILKESGADRNRNRSLAKFFAELPKTTAMSIDLPVAIGVALIRSEGDHGQHIGTFRYAVEELEVAIELGGSTTAGELNDAWVMLSNAIDSLVHHAARAQAN